MASIFIFFASAWFPASVNLARACAASLSAVLAREMAVSNTLFTGGVSDANLTR